MGKKHRFLLACASALLLTLAGCTKYSKSTELSLASAAVTGEQKNLAKALKAYRGRPDAQLGVLLDAADDARIRLKANPDNTLAQSDYNFAIGRMVEVIDKAHLSPWKAPVKCPSQSEGGWTLSVQQISPKPEFHISKLEIVPSDLYEFKGKLVGERSLKQGVGAPVIVMIEDQDFSKNDEFLGNRIFYGMTATLKRKGRHCEIVFVDPLSEETTTLNNQVYPLAADFQAPLAESLAEMKPKKKELAGMFKPKLHERSSRLARLQPYDPDKIPVLVIHGLGNSLATWLPVIDFLRDDAFIRKHYQFWFFSYPTGLPYPMTTAVLRNKLDLFAERYPDHKDIVVIGHSMGGMISRLLISDSGMKLWHTYYDKPPGQMGFQEDTRMVMSKTLIFEARPDISRVIYASASHRGSDEATNLLGRMGARLVGNPISEQRITDEAIGFARPELKTKKTPAIKHNRLPNSIDVLNPDSRFLKTVDTLKPKPGVPYHSIIGDRGKGGNLDRTEPVSSDGIVPYWSSHLDGAESEKIVPSDHWSHLHPLGMAEIKRILKLHVGQQ